MLRRPRSPVKTNRAAPAVLAEIELDDRRAQDVPGVQVGQGDARDDLARLLVAARRLSRSTTHSTSSQVEEGLGRLDVGMAEMGVAHFLALDPRTVAEHDAGDVARGRRGVDRPVVARLDQAGKPADVVVVGVRDDHRVERAGVERELAVRAAGVDPIGIKQTRNRAESGANRSPARWALPVICRAAPWNVIRNQHPPDDARVPRPSIGLDRLRARPRLISSLDRPGWSSASGR